MRQALGKGLDSLMPAYANSPVKEGSGRQEIKTIPLGAIRPNRLQPRKNFDPEKLSELAQSIRENGLTQPVVVSYDAVTNTYELLVGERRLRACQLAGMTEIDAIVRRPESDRKRLAIALIENLQREDLNPIEEAHGYVKLMNECAISQVELCGMIGKSKSAISNTLRLLELPEEIQRSLQFNQITEGHARALLAVQNKAELIKLFRTAVGQKLSVRQVEDYARRIQAGASVSEKDGKHKKHPDTRSLEESLQSILGTRVEIRTRKDHSKGKLIIHFYSPSDFDRILNIIKK